MADEILQVNGSTLENASQSEVIQYIYQVFYLFVIIKFYYYHCCTNLKNFVIKHFSRINHLIVRN